MAERSGGLRCRRKNNPSREAMLYTSIAGWTKVWHPVQARRRDRKGPAERGPGEPEAATVPSDRERETTKMQTGSASRRAVVGLIAGIAGIAAIATVGDRKSTRLNSSH